MLEGNMDRGELEIGQISAMMKDIPTTQEIVTRVMEEFRKARSF
jgi:NAD(P)H-dependent flavin oxidoreductase YrpB (nitropropane dioxygenase family)